MMYIDTLAAHIRERGNEWRSFQVEACSRCGGELVTKMSGWWFDHGRGCARRRRT